jgi:hypothetical protein
MMLVCVTETKVFYCCLMQVLSVLLCPDGNARFGHSVDNNRKEVRLGSDITEAERTAKQSGTVCKIWTDVLNYLSQSKGKQVQTPD